MVDPYPVGKRVRLAVVEKDDRVIEIGPGRGWLTLGITETGADLTAIEIDHRLAAELPGTVAAMQPEAADRFRVVRCDALELGREHLAELPGSPEVLVAHLPYNASVPILMHPLELIPELRAGLVLMPAGPLYTHHSVGPRVRVGLWGGPVFYKKSTAAAGDRPGLRRLRRASRWPCRHCTVCALTKSGA